MFHKYNSLLRDYPYRTNMFTTGIVFSIGDYLSQTYFHQEGNHKQHDWHRSLRAWTYGTFCFSPMAVLWYGKTLPFINNPFISQRIRRSMSPKTLGVCDNVFRIGIDQLIVPGLLWIPMYNTVMSYLSFHENPWENAKDKLQKNWWAVLKMNWVVWPAFQFINFTFVPIHLRVVGTNVCSIGWNCFLSTIHNTKGHFRNTFLASIHEMDEAQLNNL